MASGMEYGSRNAERVVVVGLLLRVCEQILFCLFIPKKVLIIGKKEIPYSLLEKGFLKLFV